MPTDCTYRFCSVNSIGETAKVNLCHVVSCRSRSGVVESMSSCLCPNISLVITIGSNSGTTLRVDYICVSRNRILT